MTVPNSDQSKRVNIGVFTGGPLSARPRCQLCSGGAPAAVSIRAPGHEYFACGSCIFTFAATVVALDRANALDEKEARP